MEFKKIVMSKIGKMVIKNVSLNNGWDCYGPFYQPKRPLMTREIEQKFSEVLRKS